MAMRCKSCAHPDAKRINQQIARGVSDSAIASGLGIDRRSIQRHRTRCIAPMVRSVQNRIAESVAKTEISVRAEVMLPVLDKIKLLQDRIVGDLEETPKPDRVPLYRELRGALQEEAKLCGLYQENRENEAKVKKALDDIKAYLKEQDSVDREAVITAFATGRSIPRETLARELGNIG